LHPGARAAEALDRDGHGTLRDRGDGYPELTFVVVPPAEHAAVHQRAGVVASCGDCLDAAAEVVRRSRRFVLDDKPVLISVSWLPAVIAGGTQIEQPDTGPGGTYARLAEAGHAPDRFLGHVWSAVALVSVLMVANAPSGGQVC